MQYVDANVAHSFIVHVIGIIQLSSVIHVKSIYDIHDCHYLSSFAGKCTIGSACPLERFHCHKCMPHAISLQAATPVPGVPPDAGASGTHRIPAETAKGIRRCIHGVSALSCIHGVSALSCIPPHRSGGRRAADIRKDV